MSKASVWDKIPDRAIPGVPQSTLNKQWLRAHGWTKEKYDKLKKWEQRELRTEANGGLLKTGILRELPGAIKETVDDYGETIVAASTATGRVLTRTLIILAIIAGGTALVVYNKPIKAVLRIK